MRGSRTRTAGLALVFVLLAGCGAEREVPRGGPGDPALDHEPLFPLRGGPHQGIACATCHADLEHPERFSCLSCHKHDEGTTRAIHAPLGECPPGADPAAESCFTYESSACLACHPRGVAGTSADHDRWFPTTGGASHAGVACTTCHTSAADRTVVTCSEAGCHAQAQVAPAHADVGGFAVDSRLCLRCHADSQVDRVAGHDAVPLSSGLPHFRGDCLACHPHFRADKPFGADFGRFECTGCHEHGQEVMDAGHRGLDGYTWGPRTCRTCHPTGGKFDGQVEHPAFPLAGSHATGCGTCHTDAADQEVVSCSSSTCHAAAEVTPQHGEVGGFAVDAKLCERCHADGQVDRVSAHTPLQLATGAPHHRSDCLACHPQVRADKPFGADFASRDCLGCHEHARAPTDTFHAGIDGYAYDTPSCVGCHPDGTRDSEVQHPQFPIADGTAHADATCSSCHEVPDRKVVTCASVECHPSAEVEPPHDRVGGFAMESRLCQRCHADGQVDRLEDHGPLRIVAGAPHFESECLTCHPQVRPDRASAADFTRSDCISCHEHARADMDFLHTGMADFAYESAACIDCHPDGDEVSDFEHPRFPIVEGDDHDVACSTCHADRSDHDHVTCSGGECHTSAEVTPQHGEVGGFDVDSRLCRSCHPDGSVFDLSRHTPFDVSAEGAHHREACLTCHPQMRTDELPAGTDFQVHTCVDGTCHPRAGTAADHDGVSGYAYATADCRDCHPTGAAADAVDHSGRYPIGEGTSHDEPCSGCHTDAGDRSVVTCAGSCHTQADMDDAHTGAVGGYQYTNALCLRCHPDTPAFRVADHRPFRISAAGRHSRCLTCHPDLRSDRPFEAASFVTYDCLGSGCHDDRAELAQEHRDEAGYAYVSTTCTKSGCHPTGEGD